MAERAHIFVALSVLVVLRGILTHGSLVVGGRVQLLGLLSPDLVDFPSHFLDPALLGPEVGQLEVDLGQLLVVVGELAEHLVPLLLVHLQLPEGLLVRLAQLLVGDGDLGDLARFLDRLLVQSLLLFVQFVLPSSPLLRLLL